MTTRNWGYVVIGALVFGPIGYILGHRGWEWQPAIWILVWGAILVGLGIWLGTDEESDDEDNELPVICRICGHRFTTDEEDPEDVRCPKCENHSGDLDEGSDDYLIEA